MVTQTARLTATVKPELIAMADKIAKENKVSRSRVISQCLEELAQKRMLKLMEEGYKAMAEEHKQFAKLSAKVAAEVIPTWK